MKSNDSRPHAAPFGPTVTGRAAFAGAAVIVAAAFLAGCGGAPGSSAAGPDANAHPDSAAQTANAQPGSSIGSPSSASAQPGSGAEAPGSSASGLSADPSAASGSLSESAAPIDPGFKIGIMTGTVSQTEEEFRGAQAVQRKYGDAVKHVTYPDNFMNEQETVVAQLIGLAADPAVKIIVADNAIPGSVAAARKIREQRPDILIGFVEPHEDPAIVNKVVDISIQPDQIARGRTVIAEAKAMGVKTFIHYSFPRHMSQELLARRRDVMKQTAAENGIQFVFVTAPDPMAEGGLPATQQFILEDVPRQIKTYGPQTAFFSTNCGMQDPLIKSVLTHGGYIPEQCCPSPTHGYPTALGIRIPPDKAGDMAYISGENRRVIAEHNMKGHFGTWPVSETMLGLRAEVDLLVDHITKGVDYKNADVVKRYLTERANAPVQLARYDAKTGNQYLMLMQNITY